MKGIMLTLLTILCLLSAAAPLSVRPIARATSDPLIVNPSDPTKFQTIQDAINNATTGATIFVYNGTYTEHIVINKTVSLIGQDRDITIIDGNNTGTAVLISASMAAIQGFTIRNTGIPRSNTSGIYIERVGRARISHNVIKNSANGISVVWSNGNTISDNVIILSYYNGIFLSYSRGNTISNNNVSIGNYIGIFLQSSGLNTLSQNLLLGDVRGLELDNSSSQNRAYLNDFSNLEDDSVLPHNGPANSWDNGYEGNYWSKYTGFDSNADGIGDIPYYPGTSNDSNNQDRFPLMAALESFTIEFENGTYPVSLVSNSTISNFRFELGQETGNRMFRFTAIGPGGSTGFCRITIPESLMTTPQVVLIDGEEIIPKSLVSLSDGYIKLYFAYRHENKTITIIYSEALNLYYKLQGDFALLNATYQSILGNYTLLLVNLNLTQGRLDALHASYSELDELLQNLNASFSMLLTDYSNLLRLNGSYQAIYAINATYYQLLQDYVDLSGNYSSLYQNFGDLSLAYEQHLKEYYDQSQNLKNLTYILAAVTALFISTTVYLSKNAHSGRIKKIKITQ